MRTSIAVAVLAATVTASHFSKRGDWDTVLEQLRCQQVTKPEEFNSTNGFGWVADWLKWCACHDKESLTEECSQLDSQSRQEPKQERLSLLDHYAKTENPLLSKLRSQDKETMANGAQTPKRKQGDDMWWIPLPPIRECMSWETKWSSENWTALGCDEQWKAWDEYCWNVKSEMCDKVDSVWYSQLVDWQTPQLPEDECFVLSTLKPGEDEDYYCLDQWDRLSMQCKGWGVYSDVPYAWTEECDILDLFFELAYLRDQIEYRDSWGGLALSAQTDGEVSDHANVAVVFASLAALAGVVGVATIGYRKCTQKNRKPGVEEALL